MVRPNQKAGISPILAVTSWHDHIKRLDSNLSARTLTQVPGFRADFPASQLDWRASSVTSPKDNLPFTPCASTSAHRRSTEPIAASQSPSPLHIVHRRSTQPIVAPQRSSSLHSAHRRSTALNGAHRRSTEPSAHHRQSASPSDPLKAAA